MLTLYNNIKKYRLSLGLTQGELAEKMGYADKSMIAKIEKGNVDLTQTKIRAFAEVFGIDPGELMGWNSDLPEETNVHQEGYYTNPETAQIAQEIADNKELSLLFDAAKDAKPEDLKQVHDMLLFLKQKENHED